MRLEISDKLVVDGQDLTDAVHGYTIDAVEGELPYVVLHTKSEQTSLVFDDADVSIIPPGLGYGDLEDLLMSPEFSDDVIGMEWHNTEDLVKNTLLRLMALIRLSYGDQFDSAQESRKRPS